MASQQPSSQRPSYQPAVLHPLIEAMRQNEYAAEQQRKVQRENYRETYRSWTGLYQHEQRQAAAAAAQAQELGLDLEVQPQVETEESIREQADSHNKIICASNHRTLEEQGWDALLTPLVSKITGAAISPLPKTLPELYEMEETDVHRILWHMGITWYVPPPDEEVAVVRWQLPINPEEESVRNIRREHTLETKREWIRIRWVGDVTYGRCTLRDCIPSVLMSG